MKKNKLKLITIILLIILITMIGFVGIYVKEKNTVENKVKDYQFDMNLEGKRIVTLTPEKSNLEQTQNSEASDSEETNVTESTETAEQTGDALDKYKQTKEILEKRLNKLNVPNYVVRLNEETGEIVVELPEDENTDNWITTLTTVGKLEIVDTQTGEVLLNNDQIKTSEVLRSTTSSGTAIYFSIEFNSEGTKKLEEITKTYVPAKEGTTTENSSNSENTENVENEEAQDTQTVTEKTITMKLDDEDVMSTSFEEPIIDGKMHLTVGQATTDRDTLNQNLKQARNMSTILSTKNLPLSYSLEGNEYVESSVKDNIKNFIIICVIAIFIVTSVILIVKYRVKGILVSIANIGFIALLLLTIRYWNVVIATEGIAALIIVMILNFVLSNKILSSMNKEKDNKKLELKNIINIAIKEFTFKIIPLFIISIVFAFSGWSSTNSFGMIMFWGLTLIELYNLIITKSLLKYKNM